MIEPSQEAFDDRQEVNLPKGPPPQYTLRQLFLLTTLVAVICSLGATLGWAWVALGLAPATGAFLGALACPWLFGLDYVLDDIQADVFRCLAVGFYTAVVGCAMFFVAGSLMMCLIGVARLWVVLVPLLGIGGFSFGAFMLVRWLWPLADKSETVVVAGSAILGVLIVVVYVFR